VTIRREAQPAASPSAAEQAAQGAMAGSVATLALRAVMLVAGAAGLMGEQPPKAVAKKATAGLTGRVPSEPASRALASWAHMAFGAGAGTMFGLAHRNAEGRSATVLEGVLFGIAVRLVGYCGWIPALGILPPPRRDRASRPPSMVAAHVAWGTVVGALTPVTAANRERTLGSPRLC
jgi:hypothetical protein